LLSDAQFGALSTYFTLVYAVLGVPLGRLADTVSRKWLLAGGVTVWTSLTALGGMATSYAWLAASRLGVAVGEAACAPAATSWIGDLVPPERRARALARFMLAVPVGIALSFLATGPVAQALGWRTAMIVAAAPAALLVPALLLLQEPSRGATEPARTAGRSPLRLPVFRWITASGILVNFALYALSMFLPAFLMRWHGLSLAQAGVAAGIGHLAGGLGGGYVAGWLGDRHRNARLRWAGHAALAAAPFALAGTLQPGGAVITALVLISIAYGLLNVYYGLVYAAMHDIVPPQQRGTAMAVYFLAMYLCGASFGPLITGRLSDYLARIAAGAAPLNDLYRATGLQQAMLIIPVFTLALAASLYAGGRSAAR
jgi:MFS family permease